MPAPDDVETRRQVEAARSEFDAQLAKAKTRFARNVSQVRDCIAHAQDQLRIWDGQLAQLTPYRGHPQGRLHYESATLLVEMYTAMKRFLEMELPVHQQNLELAQKATPASGAIPFRAVDQEPAYLEQRLRMDTALLGFLWRMSGDGVDAVLRATGMGMARDPIDAAEDQLRAERAGAIADDARHDLALGRLIAEMGQELAAVRELVAWTDRTMMGFARLDVYAREDVVADSHWKRMDDAVNLFKKFHARVAVYPGLARLFPKPEAVDLPFTEVAEAKAAGAAPKGPERLAFTKGRASSLRLDDFGPPRR